MKRILLMVFYIFTLFSLIGCREKTKEEEFNDIQKTFSNINNYVSLADITVTGNKSSKSFKVNHTFLRPDKYTAEIIEPKNNSGNKTIYEGHKAYLYNKRIDQYTILKQVDIPEDKVLFLGYFLKNLSNVEELNLSKEVSGETSYLVIGLDLPGNNMYRAHQKLWIDSRTHLPHKLVIYDTKGKETVNVKYKKMEYNTDIEKNIFNIK